MSTHGEAIKSNTPQGGLHIWLAAARPKTLPVGLAPVLVGGALAQHAGQFRIGPFFAALLGALFIQVGANLSNDYSDARRGADTEDRLGPLRVTAGELVPPKRVLMATWLSFAVAALCGAYLIYASGWLILAIGAASIVAGLLYTGGPRPYGYEGLGEVFVFLFFGIAAVAGTYYALAKEFSDTAFVLAIPVGLMAAAVLVVNNVRDIETDRRANKKTLAVRLGRDRTRVLYALMLGASYLIAVATGFIAKDLSPALALVVLSLPLAIWLSRLVSTHVDGPTLNMVLARTGQLELLFCVLLCAGILVS